MTAGFIRSCRIPEAGALGGVDGVAVRREAG